MKFNQIDNTETEIEPIRIFTRCSKTRENQYNITGINELEPWELFDSVGRQVLAGNGNELNIRHLSSGMYLLEVRGELHRVVK